MTAESIRALRVLAALIVGALLGAGGAYMYSRHSRTGVSSNWIQLSTDGSGFGWKLEALFNADIALPEVSKPQGQAKFLDRSEGGQDIQLGYVVKASVRHLDLSKVPAKYLRPRRQGNFEIEPIKEVVYDAHIDFILKDADGFVLMTATSEPLYIYSGQENVFQGTANEQIPAGVAKRTKTIVLELTADKCETCN